MIHTTNLRNEIYDVSDKLYDAIGRHEYACEQLINYRTGNTMLQFLHTDETKLVHDVEITRNAMLWWKQRLEKAMSKINNLTYA